MVISQRIRSRDGVQTGIAIDGDWNQIRVKRIVPDVLQYVPQRVPCGLKAADMGSKNLSKRERKKLEAHAYEHGRYDVKVNGPNKVKVTSVEDVVSWFDVADFQTEEGERCVIRHYTIGSRIE